MGRLLLKKLMLGLKSEGVKRRPVVEKSKEVACYRQRDRKASWGCGGSRVVKITVRDSLVKNRSLSKLGETRKIIM